MNLAFLILAHKNPPQLQALVDRLLQGGCSVFVHIDRKSAEQFNGFIGQNRNRQGLYIYCRYKVYWGSYNQIRATFFLLAEASRLVRFDFVRLISGQDLPVRPLNELKAYLATHRDKSFFSFTKLPDTKLAGNGGLDRVEWWWITRFPAKFAFFFNKLNVLIHLLQDKAGLRRRNGPEWYLGSNWFTLNREMALYVCRTLNDDPGLLRRYRFTRLADEIIVQTILLNSRFASQIINTPLCFIDWITGPEYPRTFTMDDLGRIRLSGEFFARKFDPAKDEQVITELLSAHDS